MIIVTLRHRRRRLRRAQSRARGFLLEDAPPEQLAEALRAAVRGDALIDSGVTARLLDRLATTERTATPVQPIEPPRGRGLGAEAMKLALRRVFDQHGAEMVVIDPAVDNHRAVAFYEQLGFERVGVREFGDDECLVMRLLRSSTD